MKNKGFNIYAVIIIVIVVSIVSGLTTGIIIKNSYHEELLNDSTLNEFLDVYSNVTNNYYEDVNKEEMIDKALDAMLDYLGDNYTTYLNKEEREALEERLNSTYKGIGITITERKIIGITQGGPAEKSGLKVGDIINKVNDIDVTEYTADQISTLIKATDKKVRITVLRGDEEKTYEINVETLNNSEVAWTLIPDSSIGYISIPIFSRGLTNYVASAIESLKVQGADRLIIDLRNDTGGYLDEAHNVASLFLEKGKVIYSLEDKKGKTNYYDETEAKMDMPVVILINENSASASEILAAALKDNYGAILIGTKSYGKGKVQQTYNLENGGMAKFTSAKWYRPNGSCIDGVGLIPDYVIDLETIYDENDNAVGLNDTQYLKAIEVIKTLNNN